MKIGRIQTLIISITCLLFLAACRDEPEVVVQTTFTPSPTAAFTPQPSSTIIPPPPIVVEVTGTAEPTHTPTPIPPTRIPPTSRPSPTPTLTPLPNILLTPATPPPQTGYRLKPWTAEDADNLGRLMEAYHDSMGEHFNYTVSRPLWTNTARYPAIAYREALLRFPDNPRFQGWRLGAAVNMAVGGDPGSAGLFQSSLLDALNNGRISPTETEIRSWLHQYQTNYEMQFADVPPPPGFANSYIVSIAPAYHAGGVTFWILEDNAGFTVGQLDDSLGNPYSSGYGFDVKSLTDPEAVNVVITAGTHNGTSISANHYIFDLSQPIPKRLDFGPYRPSLFNVRHGIRFETAEDGRDQLIILVDEAGWCSLGLTAHYEWNGKWFEQIAVESQFWPGDSAEECLLSYLTFFGFFAQGELERAANLAHYESRFDDVKPTGNNPLNGEPLEPDAQDEFRFYLALNHAVLENVEQAQDYLRRIVETPVVEESRWIEPAEIFLSVYDSPEKLYPACLESALDICPHDEAFITSIANLPPMEWPALRSLLIDWGTRIAANGSFDFDNDGESEHWLALRHQSGGPLVLWIFGQWDEGWAADYAGEVNSLPLNLQLETIDPTDLEQSPRYGAPAFDHTIFSVNDGPIYAFFRHPDHRRLYVRRLYYADIPFHYPLGDRFDAITESLWDGEDPSQVINDLLTLAENPAFRHGAGYYYYLGLAYELSGDEQNAVAAYLRAWQDDCCDIWQFGDGEFMTSLTTANPYAIMAQAKLTPN